MGDRYSFVGIEPERPNNIIGSRYSASDFKEGDYVRLFFAYKTNQDVEIREGIVISTDKKKRSRLMLEDCIDVRVVASGYVERRDPVDVTVENSDGICVRGHADVVKNLHPRISRFSYRCIRLVQIGEAVKS